MVEIRYRMINYMSKIYLGFIIDPNLEKENFLEKVREKCADYPRYEVVVDNDNEIVFGDVVVKMDFMNI